MSIVDDLMCRSGDLFPGMDGIHTARAGDLAWLREPGEPERRFLARVRAEAFAVGFRLVFVTGAIMTTASVTPISLRDGEPPGAA